MNKQANPIKLVKNLKKNKINLEKAQQQQRNLAELNKQHMGALPDEKLLQEFGDVSERIMNLQKDVRNGELLAYGVPGVGLTTGAIFGGRAIANNRSKKKSERERLLEEAAHQAEMY